MSLIDSTSKASATGSSVDNVSFGPPSANVPSKILIIATYAPAKTLVVDEVPVQVFSPEDAGSQFGFGFAAHRLAIAAFKGGQGIPVFIQPQAEAGAAAAAVGEVDFTGTTGVIAGTLHMYIGGDYVPVAVTDAMSIEDLTDACVTAITAKTELAVDGAKHAATFELDLTAKTKGTFGNFISIAFNLGAGQVLPTGVTAAVTPMATGATDPDITTALDGLGVGDGANEDFYTDVVHSYAAITATLDIISAYVGEGNTKTGLYAKTVARPFYSLTGDVVAGSSGLTSVLAVAAARKTLDRTNGVISVPDSESHPSEIAAQSVGHVARVANKRVAEDYEGIVLIGVWPGDKGTDRWTSEYPNRDIAYKGGVSTTVVRSGVVYIQDLITFYRPDSVPVDSNGYRDIVNHKKTVNILDSQRRLFSTEKWRGIFIVTDVRAVSSSADKTKARDIDAVKDELLGWYINVLVAKGWIADAAFPITELKDADSVTVRSGGGGFDIRNRFVYSGIGKIKDVVTEFDTSFAVLS